MSQCTGHALFLENMHTKTMTPVVAPSKAETQLPVAWAPPNLLLRGYRLLAIRESNS